MGVHTAMTLPRDAEPVALLVGRRLLKSFAGAGMTVRALGGVAVAIRCPSAAPGGPLARDYSDIDVAAAGVDARRLQGPTAALGFEPKARFNAVNGRTRLMFTAPDGLHLDVFLNDFRMCHRLPLTRRLTVDDETLPLADLLLTKLQVARLTHKDVMDAAALLLDNPLTTDDTGINVGYIVHLLARDWGWWRTVTDNLRTVSSHAATLPIEAGHSEKVRRHVSDLLAFVEEEAKSVRWRLRARVGDRAPWRLEPEDA
jgi:hypothetical protein